MPRQFYSHLNICKADAQDLYKCAAYGISENVCEDNYFASSSRYNFKGGFN